MIKFIKGKIVDKADNWVVISLGFIGVQVFVPNRISKHIKPNTQTQLYTYLSIKDSSADIYGFSTLQELELFETLVSVQGIGPKTAFAILEGAPANAIEKAIQSDDVAFFKEIKGVGTKAAKRIILELKDKLDTQSNPSELEDLSSALKSMGFKSSHIKKALTKLNQLPDFTQQPIETQIKQALKLLTNHVG